MRMISWKQGEKPGVGDREQFGGAPFGDLHVKLLDSAWKLRCSQLGATVATFTSLVCCTFISGADSASSFSPGLGTHSRALAVSRPIPKVAGVTKSSSSPARRSQSALGALARGGGLSGLDLLFAGWLGPRVRTPVVGPGNVPSNF